MKIPNKSMDIGSVWDCESVAPTKSVVLMSLVCLLSVSFNNIFQKLAGGWKREAAVWSRSAAVISRNSAVSVKLSSADIASNALVLSRFVLTGGLRSSCHF
jgi:hypothetical protein